METVDDSTTKLSRLRLDRRVSFLDLPPELRNKIYLLIFPCLNVEKKDDFSNPILSRRIGAAHKGGKLVCYRCHGEAFLHVSRQTRKEVLPIYCNAHDFIFQLWKDHKIALSNWFAAVGDDLISNIRRLRLNTQFLDEDADAAAAAAGKEGSVLDKENTSPSTTEVRRAEGESSRITPTSYGFPMPGFVKVNLDLEDEDAIVEVSNTWTRHLLSSACKDVFDIVMQLPRVDGKFVLTRDALLGMVEAVGWFGYRNEKEWESVNERAEARRNLNYSLPVQGKPL